MTLMSEQLIVADTQLGEASNQNGPLDAGMLSSPIVVASCQLICLLIYHYSILLQYQLQQEIFVCPQQTTVLN